MSHDSAPITTPEPGLFIAFDGGEGCGKSTQIARLCERLNAAGRRTMAVRDPGTTRIGEKIRAILLDVEHTEMNLRAEMLLYMAARAQMMAEVIRPALEAGTVVLTDRFVSSTLSYQLGGDGLTREEILQVAEVALRGRMPDLTIILDMPVEKSSARLQRAKDRIELRSRAYHERVRANFLEQARLAPDRYVVIDADRDVESVGQDVWATVGRRSAVTT